MAAVTGANSLTPQELIEQNQQLREENQQLTRKYEVLERNHTDLKEENAELKTTIQNIGQKLLGVEQKYSQMESVIFFLVQQNSALTKDKEQLCAQIEALSQQFDIFQQRTSEENQALRDQLATLPNRVQSLEQALARADTDKKDLEKKLKDLINNPPSHSCIGSIFKCIFCCGKNK